MPGWTDAIAWGARATSVEQSTGGREILVGIVFGTLLVAAAVWLVVSGRRDPRRKSGSHEEHRIAREAHQQRPEQKAVADTLSKNHVRFGKTF
jgi:hypothetical protein